MKMKNKGVVSKDILKLYYKRLGYIFGDFWRTLGDFFPPKYPFALLACNNCKKKFKLCLSPPLSSRIAGVPFTSQIQFESPQ
jgi:hypothetical protein